jgi:hypothetical protein
LGNEYKEMINAASHYPKTLRLCSRGQNSSVISEDEKITNRLLPARAKDCDSTDREEPSLTLYNAAPPSEPPVSEIGPGSLRAADQILIETEQSVYVFTVKDANALSGRLAGGCLGNRPIDAYLLPTWVESGDSSIHRKSIKAGVKFIFVIEAGIGLQRLTTSTVKALLHRKKGGAARPLNSKRRVTLEQVSD